MRLLAASSQDRAAWRQDAGNIVLMKHARVIFHEPSKALLDADDLDVKVTHRGLGDPANGRIQPRTIAAAR